MTDNDLLRAVAEAAREDAREAREREAPFIARAKGERDDVPSDDELAEFLRDATGKVDDATLDRFTAAARHAHGPGRRTVVELAAARERRRNAVLFLAAALAVAAALFILVRPAREASDLPRYAMTIGGSDHALRGDDAGLAPDRVSFAPGAFVRIDLRPERETTSAVTATAFVQRGDEVHAVNGASTQAHTGAIRIEGTRELLFGSATGDWDLVVFVGSSELVPTTPAAAKDARPAKDKRLQVLVTKIALPR